MDTIYNDKGCFYRALDDEPVFVLLARDPCTPEAIRHWVTLRQALIGRGEKPLEDHGMLAEAIHTASEAVVWRDAATDPIAWGPGKRRWQEEPAPTRMLVEAGKLGRMHTRLRDDYEQFMSYCQHHVDKRTPESDAKANVNYQAAADIADIMGWDRPDFPAPTTPHATPQPPIVAIPREDHELFRQWTRDRENRNTTTGGLPVEWDRVMPHVWEVGNRFRIWPLDGVGDRPNEFVFAEHMRDGWTGYYYLNHSLMRDMLVTGWRDSRKSRDRSYRYVPLRDITDNMRSKLRDYQDSRDSMDEATGFLLEAFEQYADQIDTAGKGMPFVAYDLAGKIAVGLRQVTRDMLAWVADRQGHRRPEYETFMDRINGYAAKLEAGKMVAEPLRSKRPAGKSPLFGEPYGLIKPAPETTEVPHEDPRLDAAPEMPPHSFAVFSKSERHAFGRGLEIAASHIPEMLDRMEKDGYTLAATIGADADKFGMIFRRDGTEPQAHPPEWIGSWCGYGVYVSANMSARQRRQLMDRIAAGETMVDLGRGQEP